MAYSLKNVADKKPATVTAAVISGLTMAHLAWEQAGDSPLSSEVLLAVEAFLLLALGLFWVDATTVNVHTAKEESDRAFLEGLATSPEEMGELRMLVNGGGTEVSFKPPAEPAVDDPEPP